VDAVTNPSDSLLPETIGDRYRIERELGRGGMARVYLARDLKHRRDVAIKVIRPELAASIGPDRFLREIEIAARLRHPNIVPLYDSGQASGALFFVMPYEEGRSLRELLAAQGALPIPEAMSALRDIARALAYAHDRGVVHRDVKPDNVMLSGGAAVVTDFGIAKAVTLALTDPGATTLTQEGSGIGTPSYMSPEQAMGASTIDQRADLYSFGCLAFELFAGHPPFHGLTGNQIVAAHLVTVPPPVTTLREDVPPAIARLIARCLEKEPARRPQTAREVLATLEGEPGSRSQSARASLPAALGSRTRAWVAGAIAAAVIAMGAYLANKGSGDSAPIALAVLPFGSLGVDSTMDIVVDGLADEVASALSRVPGVQIKSRSGAQLYRGAVGVDLAEAGDRLKADYLMTGVVREVGEGWTLSTEISRVSDATSLWSESFNLSPDLAAGAAQAIARRVIAELRERFPNAVGAAPALASSQRTSNSEAYRLYLRGQEKLSRRGGSVGESAELFRQAIALDSLFAPAYSGLAMSLALFPYFQGVPPRDIRSELTVVATRALELDPTLAQPHVARAIAHWYDYRWDDAEAELEEAVRLDPRHVEARVQLARHLMFRGRVGEALAQLQTARSEDPASALVLSWVAHAYHLNGQLDSAYAESRRALETDSANYSSVFTGGLIRLAVNRPSEARTLVDRSPRAFLINEYVIAKTGDSATARQRLADVEAQSPRPWLTESRRAFAYIGLGDTAAALSALERATDLGEIWYVMSGLPDPMFKPLHHSPRYHALLRRIGLPEMIPPPTP